MFYVVCLRFFKRTCALMLKFDVILDPRVLRVIPLLMRASLILVVRTIPLKWPQFSRHRHVNALLPPVI